MRLHTILPSWFAALSILAAQPAAPTPRETALDNLLSERGPIRTFDAAMADARKHGVAEQAILEARFLYHVDHREDAAIAALLPEFLSRLNSFKQEDSAIFGQKEDWLAVVEYVQAIASLGKGDKDAFKKHITEAFWLSPGQAAAFAPHIERMRLEEAMREVKLDFNVKLVSLAVADPVSLKQIIGDKKALLLHFWSPRGPECEAAMPDFIATASSLADKDIAVVSLLPNDAPELLTEARAMIKPYAGKASGTWLADTAADSYGRILRIRNLPTMVLVSSEGRVLFNGHPTDDSFWESMRKIDARVSRPESEIGKDE